MIDTIATKVERHERLLYGNGEIGMKAELQSHAEFIANLKSERLERDREQRRLLNGILAAIALQAVGLVYAIVTHLSGG